MYPIITWSEPHHKPINQFYRLHKQTVSASRQDAVYCIIEPSEYTIIGALLIRPLDSSSALLRSVLIAPAYRGKGLAHQLLRHAISAYTGNHDGALFTQCHKALVPFYQQHGFRLTERTAFSSKQKGLRVLLHTQ